LPIWLTQCSRFAERSSSGAASSFSAITAISMPWLRAPSSTRNGNRPLPAMRPQPVVFAVMLGVVSGMPCSIAGELFHNSAFGALDESDQFLDVFRVRKFLAHLHNRLAGVQFRAQ